MYHQSESDTGTTAVWVDKMEQRGCQHWTARGV